MALSTLLLNTIKGPSVIDSGDLKWQQFLKDHLDYIAIRSETYDIDGSSMEIYRYDLGRFLKEKLSRQVDLTKIVLLLNNMYNDFDFKDPKKYIIPSDALINSLYLNYRTTQNNTG